MITRLIWTSMSAIQEIYIYISPNGNTFFCWMSWINWFVPFSFSTPLNNFRFYITLSLAMTLLKYCWFWNCLSVMTLYQRNYFGLKMLCNDHFDQGCILRWIKGMISALCISYCHCNEIKSTNQLIGSNDTVDYVYFICKVYTDITNHLWQNLTVVLSQQIK